MQVKDKHIQRPLKRITDNVMDIIGLRECLRDAERKGDMRQALFYLDRQFRRLKAIEEDFV